MIQHSYQPEEFDYLARHGKAQSVRQQSQFVREGADEEQTGQLQGEHHHLHVPLAGGLFRWQPWQGQLRQTLARLQHRWLSL